MPSPAASDAWIATLPLQRARLVRYCSQRTGNVDAAEDLAQETLYEAWRHLHKLHDPEGLERWLGAIARNVCRRWARERGIEIAHRTPSASNGVDALSSWEATVADDFDLEVELERAELAAVLDRAMALLPPDTRQVLVQRYVQEAPQAEIARRLGVTEGAIEARLQRGKLALRRALTTRFPQDATAYGPVAATANILGETRIWCPGCGRRHLEGHLLSDQGELRLQCPDCSQQGAGNYIDSHMGNALQGLRTYKPALSRVLDSIYRLFQVSAVDGVVRCPRCRSGIPIQAGTLPEHSFPWGRWSNFSVWCPKCGVAGIDDSETWHSLTWSLPEARRFWREHPKMRFLAVREIEAEGSPAVVTALESLAEGARIDAVFLRATGKALSVNGRPPLPARGAMTVKLPWRRPLSPNLSGILAVIRLLPAVSGTKTALVALGVLATALLPIGVTVVTGILVGAIPATVQGGLDSPAGHATLALLGGAAGLIVASRLVGPFLAALASILGREVDRSFQERLMTAVSRPTGIAHLEDPDVLDLIQNTQGVGTAVLPPSVAVSALASLLPSWLQALGSALLLAAFHWWLALAWLVMWPVVVYYLQREYLRVGQVGYGTAGLARRAEYYRTLALTPAAAKELRLWGMLDWLIRRFDAAWLAAMEPTWEARHPGRRVVWLSSGVVTLMNLASFGLLAWAATRAEIGLAALAVYTQAVLGANGYRAFDDANANLAIAAVTVPSMLQLERRLVEARSSGLPVRALPPDSPSRSIRFEGVSFRYAGRSLAIVGANGADKTTLVKLLCRLYEPTGGRITVDGIDLGEIDVLAWRRQVAAIFQDFTQYHLSARENVTIGAPAGAGDEERLRHAAQKAGALELIAALPRGWDTVLSRQYAGGIDLSGGQWQRIALARALFAVEAGAQVLILNEPTASLDVRAEAELYDRFLEITAGLTTILISHRFSTVRRADGIVVLAEGRVIEQGRHEELVALSGRYAEMFALQAARFTDEEFLSVGERGGGA